MFSHTHKLIAISTVAFAHLVLQGCASVSSEYISYQFECEDPKNGDPNCKQLNNTQLDDGIVYYMPKRPIRIEYTIATDDAKDKTSSTVTLSLLTKAYDNRPDLKNMFLLRYNKNYVGQNDMFMSVNRYGLLSYTHSTTVSQVDDIAKGIGASTAAIMLGAGTPTGDVSHRLANKNPFAASGDQLPSTDDPIPDIIETFTTKRECEAGTYSILVEPEIADPFQTKKEIFNETHCGMTIKVKRAFEPKYLGTYSSRLKSPNWLYQIYNKLDVFHWQQNTGKSLPGLFYKENLPYIVTIEYGDLHYELTALSPNESGIYFAPISKTLFADNGTDITLTNGIMSKLAETTDSEIQGLSQIPADAMGAFTSNIGNIFSQLNTNTQNQTNLTASETALTGAMARNQACQIAIATNPIAGVKEEDRGAALAKIVAACK